MAIDRTTITDRTIVLASSDKAAGEYATFAYKIPEGVEQVLLGIEALSTDWTKGGVVATLQMQLSSDGRNWRDSHAIGVDTRRGIPKGRPESIFQAKGLGGQWIRAKLVTNTPMKVAVVVEVER